MNKNLYKLPIGLFLLGLGISSLIYTPMEFLYDLRLRMIPGTPAYEYWRNPPEVVLMKVYVFNITNSEQFLNGTDNDLHLEEIGPILFREKSTHSNVVFNDNSTLTYTVTRMPVYLPERNTININDTIVVPNLAILTIASYLQDASFLLKASFNVILNRYKSSPIVKTTIYNYLLNMTDPVLDASKMIVGGSLVPTTNVGTLWQMYRINKHKVTVFLGPKYGHDDFFTINNYDGLEWIPGFKRCLLKFINTSELTLYPQFLKEENNLSVWINLLCTKVDAQFTNETSRYGMAANRYDLPLTVFHRTEPSYLGCNKGYQLLPNGVSDMSACYNGLPFVASFPHFLNADPVVTNRLKGLKPEKEKHGSFWIIEKLSGIPMGVKVLFQASLNTQKLNGFNDRIRRFSNMFIPMSYVGYELEGLPWHIYTLMYLMAVITPNIQLILSLAFLATGILLFYYVYLDLRKKVDKKTRLASTEAEKFLK